MKYIKHLTAARDDEKLGPYRIEAGLEGYGFWWELLEVIAKTKSDEVAHPLTVWASLLQCHRNVVKKYFALLHAFKLIHTESTLPSTQIVLDEYSKSTTPSTFRVHSKYSREKIKVKVPNLLKYNKNNVEHVPQEQDEKSYNKEINKLINNNCKIFEENEKILIPLRDGSFYEVKQKQIERWKFRFPNVNIMLELLKCIDWNENPANEERRKTKKNIVNHIEGFFINAQNPNVIHFPNRLKPLKAKQAKIANETLRQLEEAAKVAHEKRIKEYLKAMGKT